LLSKFFERFRNAGGRGDDDGSSVSVTVDNPRRLNDYRAQSPKLCEVKTIEPDMAIVCVVGRTCALTRPLFRARRGVRWKTGLPLRLVSQGGVGDATVLSFLRDADVPPSDESLCTTPFSCRESDMRILLVGLRADGRNCRSARSRIRE
jgi:hypothetical protein